MMILLGWPSQGGGAPNEAPTNIALNPSSPTMLDNAIDGDVIATGTITDADDTGMTSVTCSNSKLKIVYTAGLGFSLQRSATGSVTIGVDETTTITATDAHGNPFTSGTFSIGVLDHLADTLITPLTITNKSGGTATDGLVIMGLPIPASGLASKSLKVYDENGSGAVGSALPNFQYLQKVTPGSDGVRWGAMCAIVPASVANGASRNLFAYSSPSAVPSGTKITVADLLATEFRVRARMTIGGAEFIFDSDTALAAGSTFSKTAAYFVEEFDGGPVGSWFRWQGPPMNAGSPHASGDGMRVSLWAFPWKAGTAAVSGGNPILGVIWSVTVENGAVDNASPANYTLSSFSIERATSMTNGALITSNDTDEDGQTLDYTYTDVVHYYGARFTRVGYVGEKPRYVWAYGNVSTADNPANVVPRDYLRSTGIVSWYEQTYAETDHTGGIALLNASGMTAPLPAAVGGVIGEITITQGQGGEAAHIGPITQYECDGFTKWDANGRRRIKQNAEHVQSYPYESLRLSATPSAGAAGCWTVPTNTKYVFNGAHPGTLIAYPGSNLSPWQLDLAHDPNHCSIAYMLFAYPHFLEGINAHVAANFCGSSDGYNGSGVNNTPFGNNADTTFAGGGALGDDWADHQFRSQAYAFRNLAWLAYFAPDGYTSGKSVWPRATAVTLYENSVNRAAAMAAAHTGTGAATATRWHPDGWRWTQTGAAEFKSFAGFMHDYSLNMMCEPVNRGQGNQDLIDYLTWLSAAHEMMLSSADVASDYCVTYWCPCYQYASQTTKIKTAADIYKELALSIAGGGATFATGWGAGRRFPAGGITISATSGSGITLSVAEALVAQASWYVAGWVAFHDVDAFNTVTGRGQITNVGSPSGGFRTVTISTVATNGITFPSTTAVNGKWSIPAPHPLDYAGQGTALFAASYGGYIERSYMDYRVCAAANLVNAGIRTTAMTSLYEYIDTWRGGTWGGPDYAKWSVRIRP